MSGSNEAFMEMARQMSVLLKWGEDLSILNVLPANYDSRLDGHRPPCPKCGRKFVDDQRGWIVHSTSAPRNGDMYCAECFPTSEAVEEYVRGLEAKTDQTMAGLNARPARPDVRSFRIAPGADFSTPQPAKPQKAVSMHSPQPIVLSGQQRDAIEMTSYARQIADRAAWLRTPEKVQRGPNDNLIPPHAPWLSTLKLPTGVKRPATVAITALYDGGLGFCCQCDGPLNRGEGVVMEGSDDAGYRLIHARCFGESKSGGANPEAVLPPQP